jgi:hypothetical protein
VDLDSEGLQELGMGSGLLRDSLVRAGAVEGDDGRASRRSCDLCRRLGRVVGEIVDGGSGIDLVAGGLTELRGEVLPRLLRVVHDDGGELCGDLVVVVDDGVSARRRDNHQVRVRGDEGLEVELKVGVEDLEAAFVGDVGPLGEEALVVGDVGGRGGGRGDHGSVDGEECSRRRDRGRHDALGLGLQLELPLLMGDRAGPLS